MVRAVAAALVLIAGAAIVLWYGNTLNSWVLGGLIGGLAALLLSIPISLTLFTFFSRRRDEHTHAETVDPHAISLAQREAYPLYPARYVYEEEYEEEDEDYYADDEEYALMQEEAYRLPERAIWQEEEDEHYRPAPPARRLPAPGETRLPAPRNQPAAREIYPQAPRQLPLQGGKDVPTRRAVPRRAPGFPGYQADPFRSRFRSEALRAARLEAAQENEYVDEQSYPPSTLSRRIPPPASPSQSLQDERRQPPRTGRQVPPPPTNPPAPRPRRMVDAYPPPSPRRPSGSQDERSVRPTGHYGYKEPQTDYQPQDASEDDLRRPIVRRAPYTYDDDAVRQEMAQRANPPIVRRSSRYLGPRRSDEDE